MIYCALLAFVFMSLAIFQLCYYSKDAASLNSISSSYRIEYGMVTGVVFLIDTVMLLYSTSNLRKTLERDFANRLIEEANRLRALFYIFTVCYLFRTVFLCV